MSKHIEGLKHPTHDLRESGDGYWVAEQMWCERCYKVYHDGKVNKWLGKRCKHAKLSFRYIFRVPLEWLYMKRHG